MRDTLRDGPAALVSDVGAAPTVARPGGVDLAPRLSLPVPVDVEPPDAALEAQGFADRYERRVLLGKGGMGEVHLCQDRRIGRDVAMKVIRGAQGARMDARQRFVREARVQGQLEHPAIVPVYDLGLTPAGEAYFTMKRIRGISLEAILLRLRDGDAAIAGRFSRRKLLTAFSNVCLSIDFAHQHGVLHRDLKPANIMLGDFGEVYVLDWGLAKVSGDPDIAPAPADRVADHSAKQSGDRQAGRIDLPAESLTQTIDGEMMGTIGYMAPEQARGDMSTLTPRADVYALGTILFEILTLEPLHPGDRLATILYSTLSGRDARASLRRPDLEIPPELDAICVKATALDAAARYASARQMQEAVDRFLDGDRDLERRREMALSHAAAAEQAANTALSTGPQAADERKRAMREVSQALALDPAHPGAKRTLMRLLMEPPSEIPEEARAEIEQSAGETLRFTNLASAISYGSWFVCFLPLILWMGIRSWPMFLLCWTCVFGAGVLNAIAAKVRGSGRLLTLSTMAVNVLLALIASRMFGPLIFLPGVVILTGLGYALHHDRRIRVAGLLAGCLSILVSSGLERAGLLPSSYRFHDGMMSVLPQMHGLAMGPAITFLCAANVGLAFTALTFVGHIREALSRAEQRVYLHTWQLRKLVPDEAQSAVAPSTISRQKP